MAASILNLANCTVGTNTGVNACSLNPGIYQRFIAVPYGTVIPNSVLIATGTTSMQAYTISMLQHQNAATRWHLSPVLTNFKDNTDSVKTETRDGFKVVTAEPTYDWSWNMNGSFCDFQNWLTFSLAQQRYQFYFIDNSGNLIATKIADTVTSTAYAAAAVSMFQFFVPAYKPAEFGKLNVFQAMMQFMQNSDLNRDIAVIPANLNQVALQKAGLIDVVLAAGATAVTSTHIYVSGKMGCSQSSMGVTFGNTLAVAGAWTVTNQTLSTTIVPSAVSYDAVLDQYNLTITAATATNVINVALAGAPVLLALSATLNIVSETANTLTYVAP